MLNPSSSNSKESWKFDVSKVMLAICGNLIWVPHFSKSSSTLTFIVYEMTACKQDIYSGTTSFTIASLALLLGTGDPPVTRTSLST